MPHSRELTDDDADYGTMMNVRKNHHRPSPPPPASPQPKAASPRYSPPPPANLSDSDSDSDQFQPFDNNEDAGPDFEELDFSGINGASSVPIPDTKPQPQKPSNPRGGNSRNPRQSPSPPPPPPPLSPPFAKNEPEGPSKPGFFKKLPWAKVEKKTNPAPVEPAPPIFTPPKPPVLESPPQTPPKDRGQEKLLEQMLRNQNPVGVPHRNDSSDSWSTPARPPISEKRSRPVPDDFDDDLDILPLEESSDDEATMLTSFMEKPKARALTKSLYFLEFFNRDQNVWQFVNHIDSTNGMVFGRPDFNRLGSRISPQTVQSLATAHVKFTIESDGIQLEPLTSLNGVFIRIWDECQLAGPTMIRVGNQLIHFCPVRGIKRGKPKQSKEGEVLWTCDLDPCAILFLVRQDGSQIVQVPMLKPKFVIGRGGEDSLDLTLYNNKTVSRTHASLEKRGNTFFLKNLSKNSATFVRIKRPFKIPPGVEILIGEVRLRVKESFNQSS